MDTTVCGLNLTAAKFCDFYKWPYWRRFVLALPPKTGVYKQNNPCVRLPKVNINLFWRLKTNSPT